MRHSKSPLEGRSFTVKHLNVLPLIVMVISSTGCSLPPSINDDLFWLEPIEFSQDTKAWLLERSPWPAYVKEDFHKITVLNDTIREIKDNH